MQLSSLRVAQVALFWLSATFFSLPAVAQQEVRIGAAHFPPYTVRPEGGADTGLLPEMVAALNQLQSVYHFVVVPTALPRRFQDLKQGRIDLAIFENPQWGWQDIDHINVDLGLEDAEVFVALRKDGRGQGYFDSLAGKRLALFSGYHYAFAGFDADPSWLASHFDATLTYSHDSNLLMVLRGRVDIAPITRSFLTDYLAHNPEAADKLMMSERVDQIYHHYAILRPGAPISAEALRGYFQQLHANGDLQRIFQPLRISVLPMPGLSAPMTSVPKSKAASE
ncbi:MAG: substrate-binding periplasmic protein [Janthinobacterium lividum]